MPDLNLNEEGAMEEQTPSEEPSQPEAEPLRHAGGGQASRVVVILVGLGVLVGVVYMLNKLGIVKIWGEKEPVVAQVEEPVQQAEQQPAQETAQQPPAQQPKEQQPAPQTAKQETKAAPQQPTKQEPKQEAKQEAKKEPRVAQATQQPAQQPAEMKPVETPAIETKQAVKDEQKADEPSKMLFKLKDPIAVSSMPRREKTMARQEMAATPQEVVTTKPKEEAPAKPKEEMAPPKKEAPKEKMAAQPKKETPAQPRQQAAAPKKETITQAVQPKQRTPAKPKQEMPKVNAGKMAGMKGAYTIQVFALRDKGNADGVVQRLADAGYPAFVEPVEARGMTWYTVRIGKYPSVSDAKKAVEGFAKELKVHHVIDKVRMKGN